jgi:hypothetical protein
MRAVTVAAEENKIIPFTPPPAWKLYRVVFELAPSAAQGPLSSHLEPFVLRVFLFGESHQDAAERALAIAKQLPYELAIAPTAVFAVEKPSEDTEIRGNEEIARQCGLSLMILAGERKR